MNPNPSSYLSHLHPISLAHRVSKFPGTVAVAALLVHGSLGAAPKAIEPLADAPAVLPTAVKPLSDSVHVFVKLSGQPAVLAYNEILAKRSGASQTSTAAQATQRAQQQLQSNLNEQASFVDAVRAQGIPFQEIYRASKSLNGLAMVVPRSKLGTLRTLPGVVSVRLITPEVLHSNSSVSFVGSGPVWTGLPNGRQADGTGVRVGIIDTGIDYIHGHFGGNGLLATYQGIDTTKNSNGGAAYFPTAKVVGGVDLAGDAYDSNTSPVPVPDPNPMDCNGHGTHVAGTAAGFGVTAAGSTFTGSYNAVPSDLRIQPGVAPKASLYAIRVFGCSGSTDLVPQAIDWALDPNGDGDFSDHLDVVNMSLGSPTGGLNDISAEAADNAASSGIVVVASSGNSGDTFMITGSPAVSPRTISVAGSMDGGEPAGKLEIASPAGIAGTYLALPAAFGPALPASATANTLVMAVPNDGCTGTVAPIPALTNAAEINGKIAVINRGTCSFDIKVTAAQAAGAVAVVVVNNVASDPFSMGSGLFGASVTIPSVMISLADGTAIKAQLAGGVTGGLAAGGSAGDLVYSASSRGPNNAVPAGLKPDITAPGVNVVSARTGIAAGGTSYTYYDGNTAIAYSGTSMAAPHVSGLMALLKQLHPTLSVEQLKALAMNSANHDIWTAPASISGPRYRYGAGRVGSGRIDAEAAGLAKVVAYSVDAPGAVSLSFDGEIYLDTTVQKQVRIDNLGSSPVTLALGIDTVVDNPGVVFSLPQGRTIVVPANGSVTLPVKMSATADLIKRTYDPTVPLTQSAYNLDRYWLTEETAYLTLGDGTTVLRVPLYVAPQPVSSMAMGAYTPSGASSTPDTLTLSGTPVCTGSLTSPTTCELSTTAPLDTVSLVSPLELQVDNPRNPALPAEVNIRRAGVAADADWLTFGFQTWGRWAQPTLQDVDVEFFLYNAAGELKYILYPFAFPDSTTNIYTAALYRVSDKRTFAYAWSNLNTPGDLDTHAIHNDVLTMSAPFYFLDQLGVTGSSGTFLYAINTYDRLNRLADSTGLMSYSPGAKGVSFDNTFQFQDLPGATIPVLWNLPNLQANGSLGALFLHHHNRAGTTAEVLTMPGHAALVSGSGQTAWEFSPMRVSVTDTNGNPVNGAQVTFAVPGSGASGRFPSGRNVAVTGADGIAAMPMVANGTVGSYSVVATVAGLPGSMTFNMTNLAPQATVSGAVAGGTATAAVTGAWLLAPTGTTTYTSGGFIPASGHAKSPSKAVPRTLTLASSLIDLTAVGGANGSDVVVTLTYPQALPPHTQFWMFGVTPDGAPAHWYRFRNVVITGNVATLTITDGGFGDGDGVANGVVRLLGGPGVFRSALPAIMSTVIN